MVDPLLFLLSGVVLGLTAGISPGPLLTLVISETLRHNRKAGMAIALAPLLTDVPIVTASVFILTRVSEADAVLGTVSILGAFFIGYLAYESITAKGLEAGIPQDRNTALGKAIMANLLSPHPYIFWMTVGAPMALKAFRVSFGAAFLFICSFYVLLIGSKLFIALLVDRSRSFLRGRIYRAAIKVLGFILLFLAGLFFRDGLKLFGLWQG